ncbi:unnamed protein product [Cercospora beticola]|nr:unnamed protein product [Cercospora beticola]
MIQDSIYATTVLIAKIFALIRIVASYGILVQVGMTESPPIGQDLKNSPSNDNRRVAGLGLLGGGGGGGESSGSNIADLYECGPNDYYIVLSSLY